MKKALRAIALTVANLGIIVSAVYVIFYAIDALAPDFLPVEVGPDFFVVDYLYLVIPVLCLLSGIFMQVLTLNAGSAEKKPTPEPGQDFDPEADPFAEADREETVIHYTKTGYDR